jgi:Gam-like protein
MEDQIDPDAFEPEDIETHDEHFRIDGPNTASWALRKLAYYRGRVAENEQLAADEKQRIDAWLSNANSSHKDSISFFESILRNWHAEVLKEDPKRKTIPLPGGKLQHRVGTLKPDIDEAVFIPWAEENARLDLIRVKSEPKRAAILAALKETGEVLPGVKLEMHAETFKAVTE